MLDIKTTPRTTAHSTTTPKAAAPAKKAPSAPPARQSSGSHGADHTTLSHESSTKGDGAGVGHLISAFTSAFGHGASETHKSTEPKPSKGDKAIAQARGQKGKQTQNVHIPHYKPTGGNTNNCANFASAVLTNAGLLKHREENVGNLQTQAKHEGWSQVAKKNAEPGDLAFYGTEHVELVATDHATRTIGSNNENPKNPGTVVHGQQWITERSTKGKYPTYYSYDGAR